MIPFPDRQQGFAAIAVILLGLLFLLQAPVASARVLSGETVWKGVVEVEEDVLVPEGARLVIEAGARVKLAAAESTKIDPEYLSHLTEITVRGEMIVKGTEDARVVFSVADAGPGAEWAGIIVDGGRLELRGARIEGAEAAVTVVGGTAELSVTGLAGNRYGLVGWGRDAKIGVRDSVIEKNDYGIMVFAGAQVEKHNLQFAGNRKKDLFIAEGEQTPAVQEPSAVAEKTLTRSYRDEALAGTTVWKGRILVEGVVRVPPEARLVIAPGTIVEFTRRDTNSDAIGENGLMIQGHFIAKGTADAPILFRSAEEKKGRGDWDAINILGSDQAQNLLEHCRIENAYRGLHVHFSNVAAHHLRLTGNYRGIQFQESVVQVTDSLFSSNKSAIQCRDSQVEFARNQVIGNLNGANFFRLDLKAAGNLFAGNAWDGLRVREGAAEVTANTMAGNRYGMLVANARYGAFTGNIIATNLETGIAIRDADNIEVRGNAISDNGVAGVSVKETRAIIGGNLISGNGDRGIGIISFSGSIEENNFTGNGLYAVGLEGPGEVDARNNWWGGADMAATIFDSHDEPGLGAVQYEPAFAGPKRFPWPVAAPVPTRTTWTGAVVVEGTPHFVEGQKLTVLPGTTVFFGKEAGLEMHGTFIAAGEPDKRILFTSADNGGPSFWNEISLENSAESRIVNCDFEHATWALHVHFSPLAISGCRFRANDGGLRFRSGPMDIHGNFFTGNHIGIRAYLARAVIRENVITGNSIGIFVRENDTTLEIHRNNLFGNEQYNVRVGDFNHADVDARENWWGTADPLPTIFDGRREPGVGMVHFDGALDGPLNLPWTGEEAGR